MELRIGEHGPVGRRVVADVIDEGREVAPALLRLDTCGDGGDELEMTQPPDHSQVLVLDEVARSRLVERRER